MLPEGFSLPRIMEIFVVFGFTLLFFTVKLLNYYTGIYPARSFLFHERYSGPFVSIVKYTGNVQVTSYIVSSSGVSIPRILHKKVPPAVALLYTGRFES